MQNDFTQKVLKVVSQIPHGKVMTYGEVAAAVGSPGAARAVGNIMKNNSDSHIPCHRVINANGKIGKYNQLRGPSKRELLLREGVKLK